MSEREEIISALYLTAKKELAEYKKSTSLLLHDEVERVLSSVIIQLNLLQQSHDLEYVQARLGALSHIVEQSLEEVRLAYPSTYLHLLSRVGLKAALEVYLRELSSSTEIKVSFSGCTDAPIPTDIELLIYQIIVEDITKLLHGTSSGEVDIGVTAKNGQLLLKVISKDCDLLNEADSVMHLTSIQERVNLHGGRYWTACQTGHEEWINVLIPLA